ncbi:hypothetical protein B9Q04_13400 [Candidatus Marsarchaeota G2 archaeon BE_D]|uniref:Uncharacterized protein n=1 Tax=Candidatus Marsarchaeota G2 archaeon BE_D TaxID=1978158 RepID=A0A2R6C860_9ARCH|nr:MAG: hypothetical protein B9Q04_13400 [Candidatus Marsarchaeota G2 archaeon BE_D]
MNYPTLTDGASCFIATPCLLFNPRKGGGGWAKLKDRHTRRVAPTLLFLKEQGKRSSHGPR